MGSYAQAFVISLLENDPDNPGRLRLRLQRSYSDGSPCSAPKAAWRRPLCGRNFALCVRLTCSTTTRTTDIEWKRAWREFLRLGNLLQFIVRLDFVSSLGLADECMTDL